MAYDPATDRFLAVQAFATASFPFEGDDGNAACIPVFWSSALGSAHVGSVSQLAVSSRSPTVTWICDTYLVSYAVTPAPRHTELVSVDAFACLPCGSAVSLWPLANNIVPASAVVRGDSQERVLLISGAGGQFVDVVDGAVAGLGGGCGDGGRPAAACAIAGNASFGFALRDARAGTPAFLALSAGRADVYEQWLVLGGTGCLSAIDLSSALGVTLQ